MTATLPRADGVGSSFMKTDHFLEFEYVSDHISLTNIDANAQAGGDQAFTFIAPTRSATRPANFAPATSCSSLGAD